MISRNLNQTTTTSKRVLDLNRTGVVASSVPGVGTSGPAYLYNDVVSLGLITEDVCGEILSTNLPFGWVAYSNGSLYVPSGISDGAYYVIYKVKVNGVPQSGTGMASIWVGPVPLSGPARNLNVTTVTGRRVIDTNKTGVTASSVPASGLNGPGYLYDDVVANDLVGKEVAGEVVATNLPGAWYAYSDSRLYIPPTTPDGDYFLRYKLKINGVPNPKLSTVNIHLGATPAATPMNRNMNQSFSGKRLLTTSKVGVLATLIPSTGTNGPAYAYNDLVFPADNNKLVRGFILTFPAQGSLIANDDTSFTFTGAPDGTHTFTYELRVDDVVLGTATGTIYVGATAANMSIVLDPIVNNISASSVPPSGQASISIQLDNGTFNLSAFSGTSATMSIVVDDVLNSISASGGNSASFGVTLDNVTTSLSAISTVNSSATVNVILDNVSLSMPVTSIPSSPEAQSNIQLDNVFVYMTASGSEPPLSIGPNVQVPITLAVDITGKLIIIM